MYKVERIIGKFIFTFLISLCLPCQSQVPSASNTTKPLPSATYTAMPSPSTTLSASLTSTPNESPYETPISEYKMCLRVSNSVLSDCLKNIENTNHAFPDYILIKQQCYASHEDSVRTVCACLLDSPPGLCFDPKLRNHVKCDIEAIAYQLTCIEKRKSRKHCKYFYKLMYQSCMILLN